MAFDYFTVQALAAELDRALSGCIIGQASSSAEALGFSCSREQYVHMRLGAGGYMCLVPGRLPAGLCADGAERYLIGAEILNVQAEKRDRVIKFHMRRTASDGSSTYGQLIVELIPSHIQVVLVSDTSGEVLGKWARRRKGRAERVRNGTPYVPPPQREHLLPGEDSYDEFVRIASARPGDLVGILSKCVAGLDKNIAQEITRQLGESNLLEIKPLTAMQLRSIWQELESLYSIPQERAGYVWNSKGQWLFSAFEPHNPAQTFGSISEAIVWTRERERERDGGDEIKTSLYKRLRKALKAKQRRKKAVEQDLEEAQQAAEFERRGNILLAQVHCVQPRLAEVELPDIYDVTGQYRIVIPLNPRISAVENAERMLKTAKKYERRQRVLPGELAKILDQIAYIESNIKQIDENKEINWDTIEQFLGELGMGEQSAQQRGGKDAAHPRRYRTGNGWSVWAGRNNKENDILTHRMAAQNDIWFHAHGYPGSHVVLRREGRKDEPGRHALEEAARIAAYWSKGRTAKKVPVVYTLVKYVSKPRGGAPGQALLKREKTLMVEPRLPAEEDQYKK